MKSSGRVTAPVAEILAILKKYRGKSSFWFLIKWVYIIKPKPDMKKLTLPFFLQFIGEWDRESYQLWCIYTGLRHEITQLNALAAAVEIHQSALNQEKRLKRKRQEELLEKKVKRARRKYGVNLPQRFLMSLDERNARLGQLREKRRLEKNRRAERKRNVRRRAMAIRQIRSRKK